MTKQEQIEEMYQEFLSYRFDTEADKFSYKSMCENFISKGYQKLHKDSVVLSKKEYEMLTNQYKNLEIKYSNLCDNYRLCKDANETLKRNVTTTRKEELEELTEEINFWHKINETALILTKEECDHKVILDEDHFERALNYEREKTRKETAKEILILLGKGFDETKMTEFKNLPWYRLFCRELKQRYGVEVGE